MRSTDFLACSDGIGATSPVQDADTDMPENTATADTIWLGRVERYARKADPRHIPCRKIFIERTKALRAEAMARKAVE